MRTPREWSVKAPPEPTDVSAVRDSEGDVWQRVEPDLWVFAGDQQTWVGLLNRYGPVVEVKMCKHCGNVPE